MLSTEWSEKASKEIPFSQYPRPQFVRNSFFNLNGVWNYEIRKTSYIPDKFNSQIIVPFSPEAPLSKVNRFVAPDDYLFYEKLFTFPSDFLKERVFINFSGVDQIAEVYLNGSFVGSHKGGYTPFTFEITDYINRTSENRLIVKVRDFTDTKHYSRGKQKIKRGGIWYSPQSGIWQSVWIESTPAEYLERVRITPDYDKEQVEFEFFGTDDVEIMIYDGKTLIADTRDKVIKLPDFKAWSPEFPFLYDVVFKTQSERIKSYFAMRKFSTGVDDNGVKRLFLNNKPYFYNGLLDQGYYPDGYLTPPDEDAMLNDILFVKKAGFNMLRKHIKIEPLLWYHYCDVNGIIVWQDMVNGGGRYSAETSVIPFLNIKLDDTDYKNFHRTDKEGRDLYYQELEETISLLYNCPCIAMWVPFNEGWGQFDSTAVYHKIKQLDKTRLVDSASGWHDMGVSDVISKHIYFTPVKVKTGSRAYVLSEFGGLGLKVKDHTFSRKMFGYKIYKSSAELTRAYKKLYNNTIIPQIKDGLSAAVYTQLTDVEDELNGIMTYDRRVVKIDVDELKKINERINHCYDSGN